MNHALKIENLNIEKNYADKIVDCLNEFLLELGFNKERIKALECRSRSGFTPYSHNKGGLMGCAFKDQFNAQFEGTGFKNADNTLNRYYDLDVENFERDTNLDLPKERDDWTGEHWMAFDEYRRSDSEATVFFQTMAMINSESELNLIFYVCVKDAPYHREFDDKIEFDIRFKSIKGLKQKLNRVLKNKEVQLFSENLEETY